MKYKLSVARYKIKLLEEHGTIDMALVKDYAAKKAAYKRGLRMEVSDADPDYERQVLERMKKRGCSKCEIRAQERYISRIKDKDHGQE